MDADYFVVAGRICTSAVATAVGGGGEDEDVGIFGVADCFFEIFVARNTSLEAKGHGNDVDLPDRRRVCNSLDGRLVYEVGEISGILDAST